MSKMEVAEGLQEQSADEEIAYSITTTNYGSDPTNVSVKAYLEGPETDVTSTVYPTNSPSVSGDVITLSKLKSLTKGNTYRIEVKCTIGGSIFEPYFRVKCIK